MAQNIVLPQIALAQDVNNQDPAVAIPSRLQMTAATQWLAVRVVPKTVGSATMARFLLYPFWPSWPVPRQMCLHNFQHFWQLDQFCWTLAERALQHSPFRAVHANLKPRDLDHHAVFDLTVVGL